MSTATLHDFSDTRPSGRLRRSARRSGSGRGLRVPAVSVPSNILFFGTADPPWRYNPAFLRRSAQKTVAAVKPSGLLCIQREKAWSLDRPNIWRLSVVTRGCRT